VHHIPLYGIACGLPYIVIDAVVALNADMVVVDCECAVEVGSCGNERFVLRKAAGRFLHHSKGLRQDLFQYFFNQFITALYELVYIFINGFTSMLLGFQSFGFRAFGSYFGINIYQVFLMLVLKTCVFPRSSSLEILASLANSALIASICGVMRLTSLSLLLPPKILERKPIMVVRDIFILANASERL
jgi:hypothetical protein